MSDYMDFRQLSAVRGNSGKVRRIFRRKISELDRVSAMICSNVGKTKTPKICKIMKHIENVEFVAVQKRLNIVGLVKSLQTSPNVHFSVSGIFFFQVPFFQSLFRTGSLFKRVFTIRTIQYLLAKLGVDTAENGPVKVCQQITQKLEETLEQT